MSQTQFSEFAAQLKPPSLRTILIGLLPSIFVNGVLVFVLYELIKHFTSASDLIALCISAVPAMIGTIIGLVRQRQVDIIGAVALISIAVSVILTFVGGDVKLLQIRELFLTMLFGIVCLISLFFPKPLWFYVVRYFTAGNNPQQQVAFDAAWNLAPFRAYIRTLTIVWGSAYVVEFIIRLVLIYSLSISQFLIISPILIYGITIALIIWTLRAGARLRKRGEEARRHREIQEASDGDLQARVR